MLLLTDETCQIGKNGGCRFFGGVTREKFAAVQALTDLFHNVHANIDDISQTRHEWRDLGWRPGIGKLFG